MYEFLYSDCDDNFAFIAGYTRGGAAYRTTWDMKVVTLSTEKERLYIKVYKMKAKVQEAKAVKKRVQ